MNKTSNLRSLALLFTMLGRCGWCPPPAVDNSIERRNLYPDPEKYIDQILEKPKAYETEILGCHFKGDNHTCYSPGVITKLFMKYLIDNNLIKDKVIADIGAGSFALGIIAVKHGATMAMGVDITTDAVATAQKNIENNKLTDKARILEGNGVTPLLNEFTNKVDILVAGAPWDTMTHELFESIPTERRAISYAFYDIDNQLMSSFLKDGPTLLTEGGKMFITACKRIIPRIKDLCSTHRKKYMIVAEDDPHKDGNPHYILEITGE